MLMFMLFLLNSVGCLEYLPPSKVIEVNESEEYRFGFIENNNLTNITNCIYRSNTGLNGSFVVKRKDSASKSTSGKVSDLGAAGLCQIRVSKADGELPTVWYLSAIDNGKALEEVKFLVNLYYSVPLVTEKAAVTRYGDFYQYLHTKIRFTSCKLNIGAMEIDLDLESRVESKQGEMTISSLGEGLCGFQCINASPADENWYLTAIDGDQKYYRAPFKYVLFANPPDDTVHVRNTVIIGNSFTIQCGSSHEGQNFCYLFNPLGEYLPTNNKDCSYVIKMVSMQDLGVWKCHVGKFPSMSMLEYRVELVAGAEGDMVHPWTEENDMYVTIGCKLNGEISDDYCRMISPHDEIFRLRPGGAVHRYMSIGTNLSQGLCAMRIAKPLQESEKGQWRCEFGSLETTGAFVYSGNQERKLSGLDTLHTRLTPIGRHYVKHKKLTTHLGEPFNIACQVSYSSDYCYIKSPNGTEYSMVDNKESLLGKCSLQLDGADLTHVGNWSCFFARETGLVDEEITIEVRIVELLSFPVKVEALSGEDANIMCSAYGLPLKYCRFISPNSQAYFIKNVQNSNRIRYNGKGLEYGECGITIQQATPIDSGKWTCAMRLGADFKQTEISATIELYVAPTFFEDPKVAIGLGTTAMVLAISGAIGFIGVRKWKRRRARLAHLINSAETSSQSDNVFSFQSQLTYSDLHQR